MPLYGSPPIVKTCIPLPFSCSEATNKFEYLPLRIDTKPPRPRNTTTTSIGQGRVAGLYQLPTRALFFVGAWRCHTRAHNGSEFPATHGWCGPDDATAAATTAGTTSTTSESVAGNSAVNIPNTQRTDRTPSRLAGKCIDTRAYEPGVQHVSCSRVGVLFLAISNSVSVFKANICFFLASAIYALLASTNKILHT